MIQIICNSQPVKENPVEEKTSIRSKTVVCLRKSSLPKPECGGNGLPAIQMHKKAEDAEDNSWVYHDDSARPMKAQTLDELHSLQKKNSAPTTPLQAAQGPFADEEHHKQQLQSISASLASLTRETGPKVVKGDPARAEMSRVAAVGNQEQHHFAPSFNISGSSLKFTHILYNLSPGGKFALVENNEKWFC